MNGNLLISIIFYRKSRDFRSYFLIIIPFGENSGKNPVHKGSIIRVWTGELFRRVSENSLKLVVLTNWE